MDRAERVVVAMDKFRSSAHAHDLATAIVHGGVDGVEFDVVTLSDGGEGFRQVFGGKEVTLRVRDPWGQWHDAPLSIVTTASETLGVIEVAEIVGRSHRPTPTSAEALAASSEGVADAILASREWGVTRVMVGCGGSATSDGGEGCFDVLRSAGPLDVALTAATDIEAPYFAAVDYAEQKGVTRDDRDLVTQRLERLAGYYEVVSGHDVREVPRAGAAGGLGGALFAAGARLVSGFDEVARVSSLADRIDAARLVITGEGRLDAGSLDGKVVSGVCALTNASQRVMVVCGSVDHDAAREVTARYPWVRIADLTSRFSPDRAWNETLACVAAVTTEFMRETR